ncbi:MAG: response regulator [Clostridiales bacterium]|jgi:signal transduction histidine kinase/CheY-like chemotaxis protein/HPt (histidine-containing phosphotransfer) domain-containing protein|nr:response regulator [Clostridiales bacterium]
MENGMQLDKYSEINFNILEHDKLIELVNTLSEENLKLRRKVHNMENNLARIRAVDLVRRAMMSIREAGQLKLEKYMRLLLDNSQNIILFFDQDMRLSYCTNCFLRVAGIERLEDIIGREMEEIFTRFSNERMLNDIKNMFDTVGKTFTPMVMDSRAEPADNSSEWLSRFYHVMMTPLLNETGGFDGLLLMYSDITDMQARVLAEDTNTAKDYFIASVSHEIRTPLNVILGLAELELQARSSHDTGNIEKIYAAGLTLLGLINDILDVSKIEAGRFELFAKPYDFPEMISETISLNVVRIASRPVSFNVEVDEDIPSQLFGDADRVKQILNNLLSNAFKFTDEGIVTLKVFCEREGDYVWMTYTVIDTGRGIRKNDMDKLFKNYSQIAPTSGSKISGTGLGLSICKSLAEMMDGCISVESEFGKGSVFTARIRQESLGARPIGKGVVQKLKEFKLIRMHDRKSLAVNVYAPDAHVLVVDDVTTNLDVARGLMSQFGMAIHCVLSGREAIELINSDEKEFDLIFMDHMMPDMDGIETVAYIRNNIEREYAKNVRIVMLTANVVSGRREMFLKAGVDDFLAKPINIAQLEAVLKKWLPKEKLLSFPDESAAAVPDTFIDIPGVDARTGINNSGGSPKIYMDVLTSFCGDMESKARQVSDSLKAGDIKLYTTLVHGIKGASRSVGALEFADLAECMELAGSGGDIWLITEKTGELLEALRGLISRIRAALRDSGDEPAESLPEIEVELLKESLSRMDIDMVNKLLYKFAQTDLDKDAREVISKVENHILSFEYDEAVKAIEQYDWNFKN